MTDLLQSLPVYLALLAALLILVRRQWTLNLLALLVQFICLFPILLKVLPLQLALILRLRLVCANSLSFVRCWGSQTTQPSRSTDKR